MKRIVFLAFITLYIGIVSAQTFHEDGYVYYYDYDHRVVVREMVACTEDYQDLWNGDYVRIIGDYVYIYRNGNRITYGDKIWLEHTGDYTVQRGNYMYLLDSDGNNWGVSGNTINLLWNKVCEVEKGDYWYLYTRDGDRIGNVYSTGRFDLFWNGYYGYQTGDIYYRIADENGYYVTNTYSEKDPDLTNAGYFRVYRGNSSYLVDTNGNRVD